MRAIDLFAGAGGFSTGACAAGARVVWAANHWPFAVATHELNHPETAHECQDLRQADWTKLPAFELLLASPACIPTDVAVVMGDGSEKPASEIRIGDLVLTHKGRRRPVVNVWCKRFSGTMIELRVWGDTKKSTRMTSDHRVWIRRRGGHEGRLGVPTFVAADDVRVGDYVAFPRVAALADAAEAFVRRCAPERVEYDVAEFEVPSFRKAGTTVRAHTRAEHRSNMPGAKVALSAQSRDLWWVVGQYLGDGEARHDRPEIGGSVGGSTENLERLRSALGGFGLRSWTRGPETNMRVYASSKHLRAVCEAFGRIASEKRIPEEVFSFDRDAIVGIVDGYLDADGSLVHSRSNPTWKATSISLELLQGLQRLCWQIGWSASIAIGDTARTTVIEGREVRCRDSWELRVVKAPSAQSRTKFDEAHIWRSVRAVERVEVVEVEVLDFEVDDDHTFCLPGIVVHNCQGHSQASQPKRRAYHDAMRATAWAVVDCADVTEPRALVVENVPDFLRWRLFPEWRAALIRLGYELAILDVRASHHGVPQRRDRVFIVGTKSGRAPYLHRSASEPAFGPCIDWHDGEWRPVSRASAGARERIERAQRNHGPRCLTQHVTGHPGVSLDEPIRTVTTKDQWVVVDGDRYRPLTVRETARAMGFPDDYRFPEGAGRRDRVLALGNAVPPPVARAVVAATMDAA